MNMKINKNYIIYAPHFSLDFNNDEILDSELMTYKVLTNTGKIGIIKEIFKASETNKIIRVLFDKELLVPYNFIKKIDKDKKEVYVELIDGMN